MPTVSQSEGQASTGMSTRRRSNDPLLRPNKPLRLDCILLDLPLHKRRHSASQVQAGNDYSPEMNLDTHSRPNHERSLTSQNPETDAVSSQTKTKKRTRPSLPCAPVARRNGQQNTSVASSRRSSARVSVCALLTPDPSIELDQFQDDLDTGLHTSEDTPRLRKRVRFNLLDEGMSSLRPEVPPEDQVMTRPTSPEVAEQEQRTQENEEDVLMTDFQLLNIPDASCLPWVSTSVPLFDGNGNASDSNVFLPPGVSCIVQSMKHTLSMEHAAREKAEQRCEQEARLRVNAERQVKALQDEITRLQDIHKSWLAVTADALASNLTQFSQCVLGRHLSQPSSAPHGSRPDEASESISQAPDVKGKGRMV